MPGARQRLLPWLHGNAGACLSAGCNSGTASCPSGTSINAGNASTCTNDYGTESCTDLMNGVTPASCSKVGQ